MRVTPRKVIGILMAAFALATVTLSLIFTGPSAVIAPLGLTFIGFTNVPPQCRLAVFVASNANDRAINFCAASPQILQSGAWSGDIVFPPPAFGTGVGPHQQAEFSVVVPSNGEAWRVPVVWSFAPTIHDHVGVTLRSNWRVLRDGRKPPGLDVLIGMSGETNYTGQLSDLHSVRHSPPHDH